jgi:DNA-binding response OmpR family regulator
MNGKAATVLVVDDDASLRLLCRVNLELEGYRVREAEDLAAARRELADGDVDVVLLDVHVGAESGLNLLDGMDPPGGLPEIALLTGSPGATLPAGSTIIAKPFSIDELTSTVRRLAGR